MPALTGTLAQTLDLYTGGAAYLPTLRGIVANAAETVAWVADGGSQNNVYRITGVGGPMSGAAIATGLTSPIGVALSPDEATLYVVQANGIVLAGSPTAGGFAQVGTMGAIGTDWTYAKDGRDGYIYMQRNSGAAIWRYSMATNTGELLVPSASANVGSNGLGIKSDGTIYSFQCVFGGQGDNAVLSKYVPGQGRHEVVAGRGIDANTDGEAFLVSAFSQSADVEVDATGAYLYGGTGSNSLARLRVISAGVVSSLNVGSSWGAFTGSRMWMLRTANKMLMTSSSRLGLIT